MTHEVGSSIISEFPTILGASVMVLPNQRVLMEIMDLNQVLKIRPTLLLFLYKRHYYHETGPHNLSNDVNRRTRKNFDSLCLKMKGMYCYRVLEVKNATLQPISQLRCRWVQLTTANIASDNTNNTNG